MMIAATFPEPLCDLNAQLRALLDPLHPKDAIWISGSTRFHFVPVPRLRLTNGELLTVDENKMDYLAKNPTDETLAEILGYIEPKSVIVDPDIVVQARDNNDNVIIEMMVSGTNLARACHNAMAFGWVHVTTINNVLLRRLTLLAMEQNNAVNIS